MTSPSLFCLAILLTITAHLRADYVFYQGFDSQGGDMGPSQAKTRKQMEAYCNILGNCQGFNTRDRAPKGVLKPVPQWTHWTDQPLEGFYRRISDYTFIQGADSQGGDLTYIANQTPAQLKVYCDEATGCVGFNTKGQVKSSILDESQWTHWSDNPSDGLWIKTSERVRLQSAAAAQNASSASPAQSNQTANNTQSAQASNFTGGQNTTNQPSSYPGQPTQAVNTTQPVQTPSNSPAQATQPGQPLANYAFYQGLDSQSGDINIQRGASMDQLKAACDADVRCVSFNTDGYLRGGKVLHKAFWNSWNGGFYLKSNPQVVPNPTLDQFVSYSGTNPVGVVYKQVYGQLMQIYQECSSDPQCIAFTLQGKLYNFIIPQSQWQSSSDITYLRMNPSQDVTATPSTYTYYQGLDSQSGDIATYSGLSVDQLKALCDADTRCVSFNTDGYMRGGKVLDKAFWNSWSGGFYIKSNPQVLANPTIDQMFSYSNINPVGVVYKKAWGQLPQIHQACTSDPACIAYTLQGKLYSFLIPQSQWQSSNDITYLRMNPFANATAAPSTYTYYQGLDSQSGDIATYSGMSIDQLKALCSADVRCVSFNTDGYLRGGKVLDRSQWNSWSGGFYMKQNPIVAPSPTIDEYFAYDKLVPNGPAYQQGVGQLMQTYQACNSDPQCVAFTLSGNLYHSLTPQSQWVVASDTTYLRMNPPNPYQVLLHTPGHFRVKQIHHHVLST